MNVLDGLYPRYVPFPRESFSLLQKLEKRRREGKGDRTSLIGSGNVTPFALKASATTKVIHPKYLLYKHLKESRRLG